MVTTSRSSHLPTMSPQSFARPSTSYLIMLHVLLTLAALLGNSGAADVVYTIPEELPPGTHVGNLAQDTDLEQYVSSDSISNLRYSFLAGETTYSSLFRLDKTTGDLSTSRTGRVDRETVCRYARDCVLPLQVGIQSTLTQFFKRVSLDINITDINDNSPTFTDKSAEVVISESVGIPSTFPLISAVDLDMGVQNGLKGYELIPAGGPFGLSFTPGSPNLLLVVERDELDHERQEYYQVRVVARDGGTPPREGSLMVNITVKDENDNEPKFTEPSYTVTVDEDVRRGFVLIKVTATDRDSAENGLVRYRLRQLQSPTVLSMFAINAVTGELTVAGDIENGDTESYSIVVEAHDQGAQPFVSSTTVTVTVRDTINSPPKMTVSHLAGGDGFSTLSEYASTGAVVAHIAVKDADRGRNGIVQCKLEPHPYFELQGLDVNEFKVIAARSLDRETVASHNVTVICTDAGLRPLSVSETFEVRIVDENDNSPRFQQDTYHVYLPENSIQGRTILTVQATDQDAGDNGKVRYRLQPNARGRFIIFPETGVIITHDDFDYERETSFNFTVVATDQGKHPTSSSCEIVVSITDVNDQKPTLTRDVFPFTVSEFARPGKVVGRVTATDFERGVNGQVDILADPYTLMGTPFSVMANGTIILTGSVDHEDIKHYYFKVAAVDKGVPPLNDTAEVQITVLDENDNRPRVIAPNGTTLHLFVSMDDDIAQPVAMVQAVDPDSGLNGQIQFIITSRNDSGRFDVDANSGEVFITRKLTRSDVSTYRLQVLVQDSGTPPLPADRTITVWIHAGNSTRAAGAGTTSDQYILITLAIVCITIILSAIIVLIIVVMRRMDRRRKVPAGGGPMHIQNARVLGSYSDRVKADNLHNESVDGGLDDKEYGGGGGGFQTFGKGICEEDEEFGFSSFGGGGKQDDVYGGNTFNMSSDDFKSHPPKDSDLPSSATSHPSADSWQPVARPEADVQSDSSGETIPSDSGRGGSEEDISHAGHGGAALNDDSRLAALHDASFQSTASNSLEAGSHGHRYAYPNPCKSSVRDPVRNSSRKHVTFKDLSAARRGPWSAGTSGLTAGIWSGAESGSNSPRGAGGASGSGDRNLRPAGSLMAESSFGSGGESPRYTQLPNRDSPRSGALHASPAFPAGSSFNSPRGGSSQFQQESRQESSPRDGTCSTGKGGANSSDCLRGSPDSSSSSTPRSGPVYVNEPLGKPQAASSLAPRDWARSPAPPEQQQQQQQQQQPGRDKAQPASRVPGPPRSSFNSSHALQTFSPAPAAQSSRQLRDNLQQSQQHSNPSRTPPEMQLSSHELNRHAAAAAGAAREWRHHDSNVTAADDNDDQRSTTTSGSYSVDNEDNYVGLDLNHSPWKDVVV